jgi:CelD/BcsL family acetyltransferase involved in cellulose biosynthesis
VDARVVKLDSLSSSDEESWRDLASRAGEPNPYFEPDFLSLSWRHFPGYAKTTLVIAQEGSEFKGLLPLVNVERRRMPPRTVARSRDYPTGVSSLCTPLVDRACVDLAVGALLQGLESAAKHEGWPGIFSFDRIGDDGPVAQSIRSTAASLGYPVFVKERWVRGTVSRTGKWDKPVDGNRRREIGRRRRLLEKEAGAELTVVERSSDPAAVDDFLRMEASGYKGQEGGLAFSRTPETAAWFREWRQRWAKAGRLVMLSLNVGDVPIAMQCYVRAGPGLFCFRIAFDQAYARFFPGAMLLFSALEYLRDETDAQWIDSCSDRNNEFFLGMLPERRSLSMLLIGTGGALDRAMVGALPTISRINAAREHARERWRHQSADAGSS